LPELDLNELSVLRFAQNGATSANSIPAHHMKTKCWSDELKTGKLLNASAGAFFDLAWTEWENANDKGLHAGLIWQQIHAWCLPKWIRPQYSGTLIQGRSLEVVGKEGLVWTE
jgi:hypothetical protein